MNLEQAIQILRAAGRPTCSCKYGGSNETMIAEAIKIQQEQQNNESWDERSVWSNEWTPIFNFIFGFYFTWSIGGN